MFKTVLRKIDRLAIFFKPPARAGFDRQPRLIGEENFMNGSRS